MRRTIRYAAVILGILGLTVAGVAAWVLLNGLPTYPVEPNATRVDVTPARVSRGRDLVTMMCASCHLDSATRTLSGKRMVDAPPEFGVIYAPNITRHAERGIGRWSDGDVLRLLRTGIRPDGRYVPPYMPKLPRAADEDLAAIVAYLRSDDPLVAPTETAPPTSTPGFLTKALARLVWSPLPYPEALLTAPDDSAPLARGRYLANDLLDCYGCHSADFKTVDVLHPERSAGFYQGGNRLRDADGQDVVSANLTPDAQTGIGAWSEDALVRALTRGQRPDGTTTRYPMLPYAALSDADARAIHAYLRTLAPVTAPRPAVTTVPPLATSTGQQVYRDRGCASCHGDRGNGVYDIRHALAKYTSDESLAAFIRNPGAAVPRITMPVFDGVVADSDMSALVTYLRSLRVAAPPGGTRPAPQE